MRELLQAGSRLFGVFVVSLVPWLGQAAPGEVYLVLGSDTAIWEGMDEGRFSCHYNIDLYTNVTRNAFKVMAPDFRGRFVDSYGQTLKLTWWMMAGQIFRYADNTDVPVPNTMTLHLMRDYHGAAIEQFGDELTLHYHTFVWTNYSGGTPRWTQANSFLECKDDFDYTVAQFLLEEATYPISFRSGWEWMETDWQNYLNEVLPFSLEANWRADWQPYHPSTNDYRIPGAGKGWNTRCIYMANISQAQMNSLFAAAAGGTNQVACIWAHLPETDFLTNIANVDDKAQLAAQSNPTVKFRYCTAVEAMQRWLGHYGEQPPTLTVEEESNTNNLVLSVRSDKPIFQRQPFVAYKDIYKQTRIAQCVQVNSTAWRVPLPLPANGISEVAIAVTDDYGNLATNFLRYAAIPEPPSTPPDYEVIVDNSQAMVTGSWVTGSSSTDKYRSNYFYKMTQGTGSSHVRFTPTLTNTAVYNVYEWHPQGSNRTTNAPHVVRYSGGQETVSVNQQAQGGTWNLLGRWPFSAGQAGDVSISDAFPDSGKVVLADAIRFVLPTIAKPTILSPPIGRTVGYGEQLEFCVLATGSAPVTYQWRFGGTPITRATSTSLVLPGALALHSGSYDVIAQNGGGAVTSTPALLIVNPPLAPVILRDPQSMAVDPGATGVLSVSASGTPPLYYQWFHNSALLAGATASQYVIKGAVDSDAGVYHVQVSNMVTAVESGHAVVSLNPPVAPSITLQPEGRSIAAGNRLVLNVGIAGSPSFTFTWRKDGVAVPGATDAQLSFAPVQPSQTGNYDVVVTNVAGSVTSTVAQVSVFVLPFPAVAEMQKLSAGIQVGWSNQPGSQFLIETSPDLHEWRPLVTSEFGNDQLWLIDTNCVQPRLFYLARSILMTMLANFETYSPGTAIMFRSPTYSGTTSGYIDATFPSFAYVTNNFPSGHGSSSVLRVGWTFKAGASAWLRLTATDGPVVPNPTVDLREGVQFDAWTDKPVYICLGLRETGTTAPIGGNGGSSGSIEWVGGRTENISSPPKGVLVKPGEWTTLRFFFPYEPVKSMTGDNKLNSPTSKGVLEQLAIVPVSTGSGSYTLYLDNFQVIFIRP